MRKIFIILISLGFVASMCVSVFLYRQVLDLKKNSPDLVKQTEDIIADVGKLIVLPKNETPTVATISDLSKLKGQPFFLHAHAGDKLLIYTKAQKAILYDPVMNKIVELAPLSTSGTDIDLSSQ